MRSKLPKYLLATGLLFLLILPGCKKKALEVNPDFQGVWQLGTASTLRNTTEKQLIIYADSEAEYYNRADGKNKQYAGTARVKDDKLKVGPVKKFHIDEHPVQLTDRKWRMVLDGEAYFTLK